MPSGLLVTIEVPGKFKLEKNLMKRMILSSFILACCWCASAKDEGFTELTNGKDLSNFETEGNWKVEDDGAISLVPRPGEKGWTRYGSYLWFPKKYKDFEAHVEFKLPKKGNSGFYFRCADKIDPTKRGIEVQILDSHGKEKLGHHDGGGVIRTAGPAKNMNKPAGEWNALVVRCVGTHLVVHLNGEQIQDLKLDQGPMKDRPLEGWIGLQDHGQPLHLRNIKIKEL